MPLLNYQLFIFFRKFFNFGQFAQLETLRLTQLQKKNLNPSFSKTVGMDEN
jgi:hypothetical protein